MSTQEEIKLLLRKLDDYEREDPSFLSPNLAILKRKVLLVHMSMEDALHIALSTFLLQTLPSKKYKEEELLPFRKAVFTLLPELDYARLIKILDKSVKMNPSVKSLFMEVNNYRVWFEHPFTYSSKLIELEQPTKYLKALKVLVKAYETFDRNSVLREVTKELDEKGIKFGLYHSEKPPKA